MSESQWPQPGRERLIVPAPVGLIGTATPNPEEGLLRQLDERHVMMMGDTFSMTPRRPSRSVSRTSSAGIFASPPKASAWIPPRPLICGEP